MSGPDWYEAASNVLSIQNHQGERVVELPYDEGANSGLVQAMSAQALATLALVDAIRDLSPHRTPQQLLDEAFAKAFNEG